MTMQQTGTWQDMCLRFSKFAELSGQGAEKKARESVRTHSHVQYRLHNVHMG